MNNVVYNFLMEEILRNFWQYVFMKDLWKFPEELSQRTPASIVASNLNIAVEYSMTISENLHGCYLQLNQTEAYLGPIYDGDFGKNSPQFLAVNCFHKKVHCTKNGVFH